MRKQAYGSISLLVFYKQWHCACSRTYAHPGACKKVQGIITSHMVKSAAECAQQLSQPLPRSVWASELQNWQITMSRAALLRR